MFSFLMTSLTIMTIMTIMYNMICRLENHSPVFNVMVTRVVQGVIFLVKFNEKPFASTNVGS